MYVLQVYEDKFGPYYLLTKNKKHKPTAGKSNWHAFPLKKKKSLTIKHFEPKKKIFDTYQKHGKKI